MSGCQPPQPPQQASRERSQWDLSDQASDTYLSNQPNSIASQSYLFGDVDLGCSLLDQQTASGLDFSHSSIDSSVSGIAFPLDSQGNVSTGISTSVPPIFDFTELDTNTTLLQTSATPDFGLALPNTAFSAFDSSLPPLDLDPISGLESSYMDREPSLDSSVSASSTSNSALRAISSGSIQKPKSTKSKEPALKDDPSTRRRHLNNLAAKRYRQKRLDRIAELEEALEAMTADRDGLRLQLARKETEVEMLRELAKSKS